MELWKGYPNAVYSVRDPAQSSDAMHVVVPLLGVVLLIVIALFIIWRCQLQKATRHHPSHAQNRYLASRTGRSLPRGLSSATPPPSYEGAQESSSEEVSVPSSDPPPKYDEIVAANLASDK
ncbi:hypothetical protein MC885_006480 [Smutsia gigantea]|nr:hypothetical protein MC885_006480 [Smutsia gigantea]